MLDKDRLIELMTRGYAVRGNASEGWQGYLDGRPLDVASRPELLAWEGCDEHDRTHHVQAVRLRALVLAGYAVAYEVQPRGIILRRNGTRIAGPFASQLAAWGAADVHERAPRPAR